VKVRFIALITAAAAAAAAAGRTAVQVTTLCTLSLELGTTARDTVNVVYNTPTVISQISFATR